MKIILKLLCSIISMVSLNAQELDLIKIETNKVVDCISSQSWEAVQDWENLNTLVPNVVESTQLSGTGLQSSWIINLKNGSLIKEEMVYYNANEKTMSYVMTETPMPIEKYTASIKVESYGLSKSFISFYTECYVRKEDKEKICSSFKAFQESYLENLKKQCNE